jgi:MFS family permease
MSRAARVSAFLALQRTTAGALVMVVAVGLGERLAERFLPLYLVALGGGALAVGALQALDNLCSALYAFPGGWLADRVGPARALRWFTLVAAAGYALAALVPAWPVVLGATVLFLAWSSLSAPATLSLIYGALPEHKRTMGVTMHSLARRIPKALGPLLGGVCVDLLGREDGVRVALAGALALTLASLPLQDRLLAGPATPAPAALAARTPSHPLRLWARMDPALRRLLWADIAARFCEQIPYAFVVIWCTATIAAPVSATTFGLLTALEMGTAMALYVPVAALVERSTKKPFVVATFALFALFPLVLLVSRSWPWLVLAFVVRGLKEFGEPTRKSLILDLAPPDGRAAMFGLYYLVRDVVVAFAAMGGALLWELAPELNLLVAAGFGVLATLGFALYGEDLGRTAPPAAARKIRGDA